MIAAGTRGGTNRVDETASISGMAAGDERLTRALGTRRASITFAVIVFATTAIQVLMNPAIGVLAESFSWTHALPLGTVAALAAVITALQSASLLAAVRYPRWALLGTVAGFLAMVTLLGVPTWASGMEFVVAIAMFLLSSRASVRSSALWLGVVGVLGFAGLLVWALSTGAPPGVLLAFVLLEGMAFIAPVAGATALGIWWGVRSRRVALAHAQLEASEREQDERVERARVQERLRIAQELHDVAGQHIAGLLSLADAAIEVEVRDIDRAMALLQDIRMEGRFASASVLAALRDLRAVDGPRARRTPDLNDVPQLIGYWRRLGVTVETTTRGEVSDLPVMVSTSVYRGLQESLTNAAKHAPGAPVHIDISVHDEKLRVTVENDPAPGARPGGESIGLGWGLDGLAERMRLMSGTFEAGPTPGGGWMVTMEVSVQQIEPPNTLVP